MVKKPTHSSGWPIALSVLVPSFSKLFIPCFLHIENESIAPFQSQILTSKSGSLPLLTNKEALLLHLDTHVRNADVKMHHRKLVSPSTSGDAWCLKFLKWRISILLLLVIVARWSSPFNDFRVQVWHFKDNLSK